MESLKKPVGELAREELLTDPKNGNVAQKHLNAQKACIEREHSIKTHTIVASLLGVLALAGAGVALYAAYSHHSSIHDLSIEDYTQMGTSLLIGGTLAAYLIFTYFDQTNSKKVRAPLAVVLLALAGLGLCYSGLVDGFKGKDWDHSALVLTGGALTGFSVMGIIGLLDCLNIRKKSRIKDDFDVCERCNHLDLLEALSVIEDKNQIKRYFKKTLKQDAAAWETMLKHLSINEPIELSAEQLDSALLEITIKSALEEAHFEEMQIG